MHFPFYKPVKSLWNKFWFEDKNPYNPLGLLRIFVVLETAQVLGRLLWLMESSVDLPEPFFSPILGRMLLPIPYPLPEYLHSITRFVLYIATFGALIGLFTRVMLAILTLGAIYLTAGEVSQLSFDHNLLLTIYLLAILTVAPGSKQFSLDALIRVWRSGEKEKLRRVTSLTTGNTWGYKLILCVLAAVYLAAGISKLRFSDGRWLQGETLGFYLSRSEGTQLFYGRRGEFSPEIIDGRVPLVDHSYGFGAHASVRPFSANTFLMALSSVGTILLELLSPLLLGPPVVRIPYLISVFIMHSVIGYSMFLEFSSYRIYIICLIDWAWLFQSYKSWRWKTKASGDKSLHSAS